MMSREASALLPGEPAAVRRESPWRWAAAMAARPPGQAPRLPACLPGGGRRGSRVRGGRRPSRSDAQHP
jgi:hypothetical protein